MIRSSTAAGAWDNRPRRRRATQFDDKREAVLRTAAALFRERGYEGASLNELADRLNVSKPTVYYYVKSKDQLLLDLVRRAQQEILDFMAAAEARKDTAHAKLRAIMLEYVRITSSDFGACLALIGSNAMEPESREEIDAAIRSGDQILTRILHAGQEDGSLAFADVAVARRALFGSLNWMANHWKPIGRLSADRHAELHVDTLLNGVCAIPRN